MCRCRDDRRRPIRCIGSEAWRTMNELALFAGAGGGILGGHLLGWRTVCAVEWNPYAAGVLVARQNDGILPAFPVWDDVQTFDGRPWRGLVDVVSGGFPCQDISAAGTGMGIAGGVEVDSGAKWPASSAKFDLASSSWKTAHCLWEEDLPLSSVILPRWGMTRSGFVFQHPTSERPISETASGLWPTPTVPNGGRSMTPEMVMNGGYTPSGQKRQIGLENAVRYWPTPKANDAEKRGNFDVTNPRNGLPAADKRWPTPTKSDHKGSGPTMIRSDGKLRGDRLDYATERAPDGTSTGGQLNPTWVEWLMGWPLGWTDLKPLGMDKFREWQLQHSPCFLEGREAA